MVEYILIPYGRSGGRLNFSPGFWDFTYFTTDYRDRYCRSHWNSHRNKSFDPANPISCRMCNIDRRCAADFGVLQAKWVYERTQGFRNICYVPCVRCGDMLLYSTKLDRKHFGWRRIQRIPSFICNCRISRVRINPTPSYYIR